MKSLITYISLVAATVFSFSMSALAQNTALNFDGVDDYITTTYAGIPGSAARSIEAWIKTTANSVPTAGGVQKVITDYGTFTTGARFTFCLLFNNAIRVEIGGSGLSGNIAVNDGLWHHVACVYDPSATNKYSLYVDGFLDVSGNLTTIINTGNVNNFRIGERVDGVNSFEGDIDEVRFYDYARSATDIANQSNAEYCMIPSGLVAYYRLNDGLANATNTGLNTAIDDSGNGNTGTLNNFALTGTSSNWVTGPVISPGVNGDEISVITCASYTSNSGMVYTSSGTYYETLTNTAGCDSILEIKLTITTATGSITTNACNSYTSPSGNYTYTSTGTYSDTLQTAAGCDSIISIDLTINSYEGTLSVAGCGSYTTPDGNNTWTADGQYPVTYTNVAGCDSTVIYNVTISGPTTSTLNITTCGSYTTPSGNNTYSSSGTYTDVIPNFAGCDSTITINLTIVNVSNSVTQSGFTLTADLVGATYQWYECNNGILGAAVPGETGQSFTPTVTGDYAVEVTVNNCTTASACYTIDLGSVNEPTVISAKIFPNPAAGAFTIIMSEPQDILISIIDIQGKTIADRFIENKNSIFINESLSSGVYFVQLKTKNQTATYKIVIL